MHVEQFDFSDNLIEIVTDIISKNEISSGRNLVIAPSKRFFHYLANRLFEKYDGISSFLPDFTTSDELIIAIISNLGLPIASGIEQIKMIINAIKSSKGYEKIIPEYSFQSYNAAVLSTKRIHKLFGEILKNKIPDSLVSFFEKLKSNYPEPYHGFNDHIDALISISKNYEENQKSENNYDPSFLIPEIGEREIIEFFNDFTKIILVSPTALTGFEKMIYSAIESRLIVITQDSNDYDFSSIRDWPKRKQNKSFIIDNKLLHSDSKKKNQKLFYIEEPSLLYQVSKVLNIIKLEIKNGTRLSDILILNLDDQFSEMLFDSLKSHAILSNLSRGINVKREPLYQFFSSIAEFFTKHKSSSLLKLISNPVFTDFSGLELFPSLVKRIKGKIIEQNIHQIFSLDNDLFKEFNPVRENLIFLENLYNSKDASDLYNHINTLFSKIGRKKGYELHAFKEIVEEAILEISVLQEEINDRPLNIFLSILTTKRLPMIGSYKEGIQILGLLETRGLSFKTVIIPGFNEGIFPTPTQDYRLLNSSLRRSMGLPGLYQQEELEFYYLKRLIDSSEKCYILSLVSNDGSIDIPSRYTYLFDNKFLKQPGNEKNEYIIPAKQIPNNREIKTKIDKPGLNISIKNFSRLDIDRIKKCQTMYYIARVLNIKEENILAEEIEAHIIGNVIHAIFYELYKDLKISHQISIEENNMAVVEELEKHLNELLDSHLRDNTFYTEEYKLIKKVIANTCFKILRNDIARIKKGYRICSELSEKELKAEIGDSGYIIKGRIDRVDKTPSGGYMIIDYKTGSIPSKKSHYKEKNFEAVQLGVYGLLFKKNYPDYSISSLDYYDIKENKINEMVKEDNIDSYLNSIEAHLIELLETFNSTEYLNLTEDMGNCEYCPYKYICRIVEL